MRQENGRGGEGSVDVGVPEDDGQPVNNEMSSESKGAFNNSGNGGEGVSQSDNNSQGEEGES